MHKDRSVDAAETKLLFSGYCLYLRDKMLSHQPIDQRPNSASRRQFGTLVDNMQKLIKGIQKMRSIGPLCPPLGPGLQNRALLIQPHRWKERSPRKHRGLGQGPTIREEPEWETGPA